MQNLPRQTTVIYLYTVTTYARLSFTAAQLILSIVWPRGTAP